MIKDDLLNLLPDFFKNILEYPEIMKAWGDAFQTGENNIQAVMNNLFVQTCDETTLEYWENLCNITPLAGMSLDDRRQIVIDALSATTGMTWKKFYNYTRNRFMKNMLTLPIIWIDPSLGYNAGVPGIRARLTENERYIIRAFTEFWFRVAPAHVCFIDVQQDNGADPTEGAIYMGAGCSNTTFYVSTVQ